jgi:hypothetical protein
LDLREVMARKLTGVNSLEIVHGHCWNVMLHVLNGSLFLLDNYSGGTIIDLSDIIQHRFLIKNNVLETGFCLRPQS